MREIAKITPPSWVECDLCGEKIEPGEGIEANRFRIDARDKGKIVSVDIFLPVAGQDLHKTCLAEVLAKYPVKPAPRTRAAKPDAPNAASQTAPDAAKKSKKGAATNEQAG